MFFTVGSFDLGFELNGKPLYIIRYTNSSVWHEKNAGEGIGEYGCTLDKTSRFIYKTSCRCSGFFIRKLSWKDLLVNHAFVLKSYIQKVKIKHSR